MEKKEIHFFFNFSDLGRRIEREHVHQFINYLFENTIIVNEKISQIIYDEKDENRFTIIATKNIFNLFNDTYPTGKIPMGQLDFFFVPDTKSMERLDIKLIDERKIPVDNFNRYYLEITTTLSSQTEPHLDNFKKIVSYLQTLTRHVFNFDKVCIKNGTTFTYAHPFKFNGK